MPTQLPLFRDPNAPSPPCIRRSRTSVKAATEIKPKAATLRERVYSYLAAFGPCTDEQMQDALDMPGNTCRPRRRELEKAGRIVDSGRTTKTRSGREAVLWMVRR